MPSPLTHIPKVFVNYLLDGEEGLSRIEERLHRAAHQQPGEKFGKGEALYLPQSPFLPDMWRNSCERCRFYSDGEPGKPATCHIVGREGDRWGGEAIHPRGWCAYYLPAKGEPAFTWLPERLNPNGASTVRGQYRPPLQAHGVHSESREREVPVTVAGHGSGDDEHDGGAGDTTGGTEDGGT